MKSLKLLAALAIPAMFAACTSEDVFKVDTPQKMKEVVGAELIGTDISLNASMGEAETRFAGGGSSWDKEDRLGLAWVVNGAPSTSQAVGNYPDKTELFANHLFEVVDSKFETKGNIYKGWHFAYYPFAYQEEVGSKTILINSSQEVNTATDEGWYKRMSQGVHVSAMHFLTKDNLDPETYKLDKEFVMKNVLSNFVVRTNPAEGSSFNAKDGALKDYIITSVTLKTGRDVFATYASLDPTKIHRYDDSKTAKDNETALINSFKDAFTALKKDGTKGRETNLTTEIKVSDCLVSGANNDLVIFALPFTDNGGANMNKEQVAIEIAAGDYGTFVIDYDGASEKNKKALDALVAAYKNNSTDPRGLMTMDAPQTVLLDIELRNEDFVVSWDNIMNITDWQTKVQLANDLKLESPVFTLGAGANIVFDSENPVIYPDNGVTVKAADEVDNYNGRLRINYSCEWLSDWNENMAFGEGVAIYVENNCTLTVNGELTPNRLVNNGVILAGGLSTVGAPGKLVNAGGEVIVEYGAYVNASSSSVGVITYVVPVNYSVDEIKTLIAKTGNTAGHAQVNNLKIGKDVVLDFTAPTTIPGASANTDRYNPSNATPDVNDNVDFGNLSEVSLVVEEGGVAKSTASEVAVNNVTMNGGTVGPNIKIGGTLKATSGVNTVTATEIIKGVDAQNCDITITANEIKGGLTVISKTNSGITVTGNIEGNVVVANATVSAGNINGNVDAESATITTNTIDGEVTANGTTAIENAVITGNVTVESGVTTLENVKINGILTIKKGAKVIINSEKRMTITEIINDGGELESDNDIKVENITLQNQSKTTLGEGWDNTVWYTNNYVHNNSQLNGYVKKADAIAYDEANAATENGKLLVDAIKAANDGDAIYVPAGSYEFTGENLGTGPMIIDKSISIIGEEGTTIKGYYNNGWLKATRVISIDCGKAKNVVLENLTFEGNETGEYSGANIYIRNNSNNNGTADEANVVLKNVNCKDVRIENAYIAGATINGTLENCDIDQFTIGGWEVDGTPSYSTLTYDESNTIGKLIVDNASVASLSKINGVVASHVGEQ